MKDKQLKKWEKKAREVAADLREPLTGNDPEHQAKKLDKLADEMQQTRVHGSGTGKE